MKKNTLGFKEFIAYSLLINIIAYLFYRNVVFSTIGKLTLLESNIILGGLVIGIFLVNLLISWRWGKNEKAVWTTTLLAYGIYTSLAYSKYAKKAYMIIWIVTLVVVAIYLAFVFGKRITNSTNKKKLIRKRNRRGYEGVRSIVACASLVFTLTAFVQNAVIGGKNSNKEQGTTVYGTEYELSANMDTILLLQSKEWENLGEDLDTKLAVLQTVVNCEGRYLGFNKKITVYASNLHKGVVSYFSPDYNAIYIDTNHILNDRGDEVLDSVLHESFHVAQFQIVDIYNALDEADRNAYYMQPAKALALELEHYTDGEDDYSHYYEQSCESTAREYSEARSKIIFDMINEFLQESKKYNIE